MNTRLAHRGFTLVELVATIVVFAVIGSTIAFLIQRSADANTKIGTRGAVYSEASAAMDVIVRKLQNTPIRAASSPGVPSFASFSATSVTWDDASQLDLSGSTIRLRDVAAGDGSGITPPDLLTNVTSFTLTPCNNTGASLFTVLGVSTLSSAQGASVQRVIVQFTMTREGQSCTLRTVAFVRASASGSGT